MASIRDAELGEFEDELALEGEGEGELSLEGEGIFGSIGSAFSGLLGEGEDELAMEGELGELEGEGEGEFGELGELGESELAMEGEFGELGELEVAEMFSFRKFMKKALPVLRRVVKVAAPAIGTAFGGPLGGKIGSLVARNLEGELGEFESEFGELEGEFGEMELHEVAAEYEAHAQAELTETEAHAELMAAAAAGAESEYEAEALIGAATWAALTPRERRELRRTLPHMVRASALLTRLLRRRRVTRPMVRTLPSIVHHTARTLVRQRAQTGQPITRRHAARAMTGHTRRTLTSPQLGSLALQRNVRAARQMQRASAVPVRGMNGARRPRPR